MFDFPFPAAVNQTVTAPTGAVFSYDGAKWVAASGAAAMPPGGPFLPLAGGTVTGPTSLTNVSYNMLASGAVGDGVADDTAKIQTWLNTLPVGVEVVLPANHQFLIDSADLILPMGLTICGQGGLESGANLSGPAFIINPSRRIVVQSGDRLSNFKVLRKGLLASPTTAQSNAAVAAWAAEAPLYQTSAAVASGLTLPFTNTTGITVGMRATADCLGDYNLLDANNQSVTAVVPNTSVTISRAVGPYPIPQGTYVRFGNSVGLHLLANSAGISLDRLFILGFNTGILTESGRYYIDSVESDCTMAMYILRGGDASYISKVHCVPYYGGDWSKRPGPNFLLTRGDGFMLEECTSVGWANGFVLWGNVGGVSLIRCWMETTQDGVTPTTSFKVGGWIVNEITLLNCIGGGYCGFDLQHSGGAVILQNCVTAVGATDALSVAHFRLGPGSIGSITSPFILSGGQTPFVVQAGVGQWQITTPTIYSPPNPWITGASSDLNNIVITGGPALNGTINTSLFDAPGGLRLQTRSGAQAVIGGPLTQNWLSSNASYAAFGFWDQTTNTGYGVFPFTATTLGFGPMESGGYGQATWMQLTATDLTLPGGVSLKLGAVNTDIGSTHGGIEMYPGYGGFGVTAATLNYNFIGTHQFVTGGNAVAFTIDGGGVHSKIGFIAETNVQIGGTLLITGASNAIQVGSTANTLVLASATAGNSPSLQAGGVDTNVTLVLTGKGTGGVQVSSRIGFNSAAPIAKPTVSGAKGSNAALASLIAALSAYGLITDTTTA